MKLGQCGLVIKCIDMTDRSRAVNHEHLLGRTFKVALATQVGIVGINVRTYRTFTAEFCWILRGG